MTQIIYLIIYLFVWKSNLFSTYKHQVSEYEKKTRQLFTRKCHSTLTVGISFFFFFQNQPIQKMSQILFNGVPCEVSCSVKMDYFLFCQYCVEYQIPERHRRDGGQRLFTATGALYTKRCMPRSVISFEVTILSMITNSF